MIGCQYESAAILTKLKENGALSARYKRRMTMLYNTRVAKRSSFRTVLEAEHLSLVNCTCGAEAAMKYHLHYVIDKQLVTRHSAQIGYTKSIISNPVDDGHLSDDYLTKTSTSNERRRLLGLLPVQHRQSIDRIAPSVLSVGTKAILRTLHWTTGKFACKATLPEED